jgi:hypothetical protein
LGGRIGIKSPRGNYCRPSARPSNNPGEQTVLQPKSVKPCRVNHPAISNAPLTGWSGTDPAANGRAAMMIACYPHGDPSQTVDDHQ